MGAKARHKKKFLAQHPLCCFCGGKTPSAEPDHVPSKAFFDSRKWPEGFEFPACVACNRATRHDEQIVAMLSRIYPDATTPEGKAEVEERIRAVVHNYPKVLEEMKPTIRQLRDAAKKYGIFPASGQSHADLPLLSARGPLINGAIENFSRKLFCALYYKHANAILSSEGGIAVKWYSNIQIENEEIPRELAAVLAGFPKLERARTKLDDQFFYRWGVADTKTVAAFLTFFRRSFAILGYINVNATAFVLPDGAHILRPYVRV